MNIFLSIPFLVFMPMIISIILLSPLFTSNEVMIRRFSKGIFSFHFLYVLFMLLFFNNTNPYTSNLNFFGMDWIQSLGISFSFKMENIQMMSLRNQFLDLKLCVCLPKRKSK